jgi:hypothetical protein
VFTKKTLKNHLHVILKKLKTKNSNEEELKRAKILCDELLECLKTINGQI